MQQINQIIKDFNIPIREILIEENLTLRAADLIDKIGFSNKKILLVTDQNIYPIAKRIIDQTSCDNLILNDPRANQKHVDQIINHISEHNLIIAVGSGVINDLCKVASSKLDIPYIVFGTAPSMNGYASANASITIDEYKTSIPAQLPSAIYLDLEVLRNTPIRLIKSGIGDSLCFGTCQFDWMLSNFILGTCYNNTPFEILQEDYRTLTNNKFSLTDNEFIKILAKTLILSGIGMYVCKGSYPASQAEHLIAHYIEILYPKVAINSYHGEQIAVTTLSVAQIQERILRTENLQIKPIFYTEDELNKIFDKSISEHFIIEIKKKEINQELADKINQNLQKNWKNFKTQLEKIFISKNELLNSYNQFFLPRNHDDLGWNKKIYDEAMNNAHLIRNRFTSLDLIKIIL